MTFQDLSHSVCNLILSILCSLLQYQLSQLNQRMIECCWKNKIFLIPNFEYFADCYTKKVASQTCNGFWHVTSYRGAQVEEYHTSVTVVKDSSYTIYNRESVTHHSACHLSYYTIWHWKVAVLTDVHVIDHDDNDK